MASVRRGASFASGARARALNSARDVTSSSSASWTSSSSSFASGARARASSSARDVTSSSSASSATMVDPYAYVQSDKELDVVLGPYASKAAPATGTTVVFSTTASVDVLEVERLCDAVGWPSRPRRKIKRALENSFMVATLYEVDVDASGARGETNTGRLIGCARATSDHVFNATLWDIIVDPEYQGQGLGKAMVMQMIRAIIARDVANVTLFADEDVLPFYRAMGFVSDPEGIKGMFLYPS